VLAMQDPNADLNSIIPASAAPGVPDAAKDNGPMVPDHLKDLDAEELPEDQRGVVLDQIASFRVQAQKKEDERKRKDELLNARSGGPSGGYNQGGQNMRQWGARGDYAGSVRPVGGGPQGYNQPINFSKAQTAEGKQIDERTDEEAEELRKADKKRRQEDEYRAVGASLLLHLYLSAFPLILFSSSSSDL
jgi:RNA-binding protein 25